MKKFLFIIICLAIAAPALAAGDDVVFSEDVLIHIDDLNINLTVKAGSKVELLTIGSSYFTATLASGSLLAVESPNRRNLSNSVTSTTCPADTSQPSSVTLSAVGAITVTPSVEQCTVQSAAIPISSGGGGGGGGGAAVSDIASSGTQISTIQSSFISGDGTQVTSETLTTKEAGIPVKTEIKADISVAENPANNQTISLNTSPVADVKEVKVELSKEILVDLSSAYGSKNIAVNIESSKASAEQKTNEARSGMFLVGFDVFTVKLSAGDTEVKNFSSPVNLSFDVSGIPNPENLKVYYYSETKKIWEKAGDGGKVVNNKLVVAIDHLTDFSLMKETGNGQSANTNNAGVSETKKTKDKNISAIAVKNSKLFSKLKGKIILKVESKGEAYYVNPADQKMYSLGRPDDAFKVMREKGVGITNADLNKIQIGLSDLSAADSDGDGLPDIFEDAIGADKNKKDTDGDGYDDKTELEGNYNLAGRGKLSISGNFSNGQKGKIFLQVESRGEAWYVNPNDGKRYFLGRPADAFNIMRKLGLGISNKDFDNLK
ncbi:hypothetical protein HY798_00165 [Candidatus Falkowbacteria bacterium]|nr:hypothetical protein [Candidatus Falkowbacteria bacterium]